MILLMAVALSIKLSAAINFSGQTVFVVDCAQYNRPPRSALAYYSGSGLTSSSPGISAGIFSFDLPTVSPSNQQKPDTVAPIADTDTSYMQEIVPNLGSFDLTLTARYGTPGTRSGSAVVNSNANWWCYAYGGQLLYTDTTHATVDSPFAQCITRHYCTPVPQGGTIKATMQLSSVCTGDDGWGGTGDVPGSNKGNTGGGVALPRHRRRGTVSSHYSSSSSSSSSLSKRCSNSGASNMWVTTYNPDGSQLCYTGFELDVDTDLIPGTYQACGASIVIESVNGPSGFTMHTDVVAANGQTVACGSEYNTFAYGGGVFSSTFTGTYTCSWN